MTNKEHLRILKQGVGAWNEWRRNNSDERIDLSDAHLNYANLIGADLTHANLDNAFLHGADLTDADLKYAHLRNADLSYVDLRNADLRNVDISGADLSRGKMIETNFSKATLTDCKIYGISAWGLNLEGATQLNLIITPPDEPVITVDDLEVAQFIYLMIHNEKIQKAIDTITSKVVLILGRFGIPERKSILDALKNHLRNHRNNYLPIVFDFEKPANRDLTETITLLARMSRFIIADITEPKSIPQELQAIVPDLLVPVQPLLLEDSEGEWSMFKDLRRKYHWVLAVHQYKDRSNLLESLENNVISPLETKLMEIKTKDQ